MIANPYFMQQKEAYFQWGGEISGLEDIAGAYECDAAWQDTEADVKKRLL